ncbi:malonate decarboxylase holo-ACP synthase [Nocardia sp. NPDC005825]|uniref:malonate decarboxylase holo-ACP synthase n=1 Tax=unclassified Nocardia TaxID=2637762 RepID=UPI0033D9924B
MTPAPHDLLRISRLDALCAADVPLTDAQRGAAMVGEHAWVVVRRAPIVGRWIPVGIRGESRSQRYRAQLAVGDVRSVIAPTALIHLQGASQRRVLPAFRALDTFRATVAEIDARLSWGPVGSVGFELATGAATVTPASDLDVLLTAPERLSSTVVAGLRAALAAAPARVDVQVVTPLGGFSFDEWARTGGPVALRTDAGPVLTDAPWG